MFEQGQKRWHKVTIFSWYGAFNELGTVTQQNAAAKEPLKSGVIRLQNSTQLTLTVSFFFFTSNKGRDFRYIVRRNSNSTQNGFEPFYSMLGLNQKPKTSSRGCVSGYLSSIVHVAPES